MVPYYQNRHARQIVGLEGPDLAGQRHRQLMTGARGTTHDSIQQFDCTQFHVASESRPGVYYEINLNRLTCNCPDFPRSRFCKHLATINVYFPHLCKQESGPPSDPEFGGLLDQPERVPTPEVRWTSSPQESLQKLMQDIKSLSHQLDDKISDLTDESAPAVMEAIHSVKYSLMAAIASTQGSRVLPDKEDILPNQNLWTETAERMGTKRAPKHHRLPNEHGLTVQSISVDVPQAQQHARICAEGRLKAQSPTQRSTGLKGWWHGDVHGSATSATQPIQHPTHSNRSPPLTARICPKLGRNIEHWWYDGSPVNQSAAIPRSPAISQDIY